MQDIGEVSTFDTRMRLRQTAAQTWEETQNLNVSDTRSTAVGRNLAVCTQRLEVPIQCICEGVMRGDPAGTLIDLGCADGTFGAELSALTGIEVFGIDQRRYPHLLGPHHFIVGSLNRTIYTQLTGRTVTEKYILPQLPESSVNIVTAIGSLFMLFVDYDFGYHIVRILKVKGRAFFDLKLGNLPVPVLGELWLYREIGIISINERNSSFDITKLRAPQ